MFTISAFHSLGVFIFDNRLKRLPVVFVPLPFRHLYAVNNELRNYILVELKTEGNEQRTVLNCFVSFFCF